MATTVANSQNLCMAFHQISRICLSQEDVELLRFWGGIWKHVNTFKIFWVLRFVGVPMPKPMHGCYPKEDLELIRFWRVSDNSCCHGNVLTTFQS